MKVIEIFKSIDGEGIRAGLPTTFIRLAGCNLRCDYCDSEYTFDMNDGKDMSIEDIIQECVDNRIGSITLTGGEPLIHKDVEELLIKLNETNVFDINVETNGTIDPSKYHMLENVWFTVDYKCPSSGLGIEDAMNPQAFKTLRHQDVLKFVVGSKEDMECAYKVIAKYSPECSIYFSPVFGFDASKIVDFLLEKELYDCKVQLQLHKYIWNPDKRGV